MGDLCWSMSQDILRFTVYYFNEKYDAINIYYSRHYKNDFLENKTKNYESQSVVSHLVCLCVFIIEARTFLMLS